MSSRRSSFTSSTTSSLAKRHAPAGENVGKNNAVVPHLSKKRAPLGNITNQRNVASVGSKSSAASSNLVPSASKVAKTNKGSSAGTSNLSVAKSFLPNSNLKSSTVASSEAESHPRKDDTMSRGSDIPPAATCSLNVSPSGSDGKSVSMDETMSTCDSFSSPEVEYMDNKDVQALDSIDRKTFSSLCISDNPEPPASICTRDVLMEKEADEKIVNIDNNHMDPQLCASDACDIYTHLRASETKKRPSTDFMEKIQKDITANMRAILVDWLVEVAEEYRLVPDTLYLTVNYVDRYLSGNVMNRQKLQLLGVACMMIASKYEEICAPQVEEFCYITDNTYFKEEVLEMESIVLNFLKFEMTAPTVKCFLRRFARAAQGTNEAPSMQLECMINYVAELSLPEYNMLRHAPSLTAASAIFLAKYILSPSKRPWNSTLQHYTHYKPSDLRVCVKDLHTLCCNNPNSNLPAIREKYSQHKYKCVAQKFCPSTIPSEYFNN